MSDRKHISESVMDWIDQERQLRKAIDGVPDRSMQSWLLTMLENEKTNVLNEFAVSWNRLHHIARVAEIATPTPPKYHYLQTANL